MIDGFVVSTEEEVESGIKYGMVTESVHSRSSLLSTENWRCGVNAGEGSCCCSRIIVDAVSLSYGMRLDLVTRLVDERNNSTGSDLLLILTI